MKLIIGNLKNNNIDEIYLNELSNIKISNKIIILPNKTDINKYNFKNINFGSQNDISKNYNYVLLGHHDVRDKETDIGINKKIIECIEKNINVILCVDSIDTLLKDIKNIKSYKNIIIAYEEDEFIGSNNILPNNKIIDFINKAKKITNNESLIIYGGGININNINELINIKELDGIILGSGASNIDNFISIIKAYEG